MDLVKLDKGEIFCDSNLVADKFQIKHSYIVRTIKKLNEDLLKLRVITGNPKCKEFDNIYRGQAFKSYAMNREYFSLISMRFRSVQAFEWQVKFNSAFYDMEKKLLIEEYNKKNEPYLLQRQQGKIVRKETTDQIKDFVDYATAQGSSSAKFYYKHITNATYKALGLIAHKQPKIRDVLDIMQLAWLMTAEGLAQQSLKRHMAEGEHYKTIFVLVKQDIERFADSLFLKKLPPGGKIAEEAQKCMND